ncbi:MAG: hypothetical protein VKL59_21880 [Nostocaceae cyanobacterium]|nr:hypothetical protein [Nostocaceae cyanobacterium]
MLDTFRKYLQKNKIKPEKIIVLLTNQAQIFNQDQIIYENCPFWQDTCTLQPLFAKYLQDFYCPIEFHELAPISGRGIDHWNETLGLVQETLNKIEISPLKTAYISHQAGTPAISSAVQFVSLSRFKKVKFLVSNEFFDENYERQSEAEPIESSNYWRGIQIQKAKQLIVSGFPGAALKVLEDIEGIDEKAITELKDLVDLFNLKNQDADDSQELEIYAATQRIVDALDLIGFFFNQQNYLQGISLLSAAQETFLKVAILNKIANLNKTISLHGGVKPVFELVEWVPLGLFLSQSVNNESVAIKKDILQKLQFPVAKYNLNSDEDFKITNRNFAMLAWLESLEPKFKAWHLLKWYCNKKRNGDEDLRNQYMHNLRGMEDSDVIQYLLGYENYSVSSVMDAYTQYVKEPFMQGIDLVNLPYKREKLKKRLEKLADSLC